MRMFALAVGLLVGILPAASARAADAADERAPLEEQARTYFAIGARHFHDGEYVEAIAAFQAGYRRSPQPLFLFNIAQAARKSGQVELAIESYDQYLQHEPSPAAPQRAEAEQQLVRLRRRSPPPSLTTSAPSAPEPRPTTPAQAVTSPPATAVAATQQAPAVSRRSGPAHRAWWARGWFWGTVAGVVVVGAGVGVGLGLGLQPRAPERPSLGSVSF